MPSLFEEEIHSQPEVISRLLRHAAEQMKPLAGWLKQRSPAFVMIVARGTSDNAATYAKYAFGGLNRLPVALAAPSLYTRYGTPPQVAGGLVIGISQSGKGEDVRAVIETARKQGAPTLALTNDLCSPLAEAAEAALPLLAGEERSVAASKTYTASLTAIAALAAYWSESGQAIAELQSLPAWLEAVLARRAEVDGLLRHMGDSQRLLIVGRGYNYATVHEIALKLKELAYIGAEGYSAADFRHGPIARLERGFPVLAIAPAGPSLADMSQLCDEILATGAALGVVSNQARLRQMAYQGVGLPEDLPEWLSPIVAVVPGQLLALKLALHLGLDPDRPRRLSKITITR
jgi:glucosamine--fructose-6-phosphate aminotransferase (isomerizing)